MGEGTMENKLLYKPNQLIMSTNKDISVSQKKAYNYILFEAREQLKKDPNKEIFDFNISDIKRNSGIQNTNNKRLKDDLTTLLTTTVEIVQGDNWDVFTLLSRVKKTNGSISISLNDVIKEALISNNYYTTLNLLEISQLTGKYAVIIYEMYLRYKNKEIPYLTIEEFKQLTGTSEVKSYENFARLKAKVINVAIKEIEEKIGVSLNYITKTKGRKVIGIKFKFDRNTAKIKKLKQDLTENRIMSDNLEKAIEKAKNNRFISKAWNKRTDNKINKLWKDRGEEYTKGVLKRAYDGCKSDIKATLVQYLNGIMKNIEDEMDGDTTKVGQDEKKKLDEIKFIPSSENKEDPELMKYKNYMIKRVKETVKESKRFEIISIIMASKSIEEIKNYMGI